MFKKWDRVAGAAQGANVTPESSWVALFESELMYYDFDLQISVVMLLRNYLYLDHIGQENW